MKNINIPKDTLIKLLKSTVQNDSDKLNALLEQVIEAHTGSVKDLIEYITDKKSFTLNGMYIGQLIQLKEDFTWSGSGELGYYKENNLIKENHIIVKIININSLSEQLTIGLIEKKGTYVEHKISTYYVKKIDIF